MISCPGPLSSVFPGAYRTLPEPPPWFASLLSESPLPQTLTVTSSNSPNSRRPSSRPDLPNTVSNEVRTILRRIEQADLLVVGTPVYRASYTGALKHLFDLVDHRAFASKPIVLAATGGSLLHGLVIEHQLRPLFGFLNALTLPTAIYAVETDFTSHRISNPNIQARIERAVQEATTHLDRLSPFARAEAAVSAG